MPVLIVASLLAGLAGFLLLTQATYGVGILAGACLLAIYARLAQANQQHKAALGALAIAAKDPSIAPADAHQIKCRACGATGTRGPSACPSCGAAYA